MKTLMTFLVGGLLMGQAQPVVLRPAAQPVVLQPAARPMIPVSPVQTNVVVTVVPPPQPAYWIGSVVAAESVRIAQRQAAILAMWQYAKKDSRPADPTATERGDSVSSSILQAVWPGERHENVIEYRNSWGTAPIVWSFFCATHLGLDEYWWLLNGSKSPNALWDSWCNDKIKKSHRAVLLFTCEHIYVKKGNYARFAKDLREFLDDVTISANQFNHWPRIAQVFESDPAYPALALWCTTVVGDPWNSPYDDEKDEYGPFDWSKAKEVYDEIDAK